MASSGCEFKYKTHIISVKRDLMLAENTTDESFWNPCIWTSKNGAEAGLEWQKASKKGSESQKYSSRDDFRSHRDKNELWG